MKRLSLVMAVLAGLSLTACSKSKGGNGTAGPIPLKAVKDESGKNKNAQCPLITENFCRELTAAEKTEDPTTDSICYGYTTAKNAAGEVMLVDEGKQIPIDGKVRESSHQEDGGRVINFKEVYYCEGNTLYHNVDAGGIGSMSEEVSLSADGQTLTVKAVGSGEASVDTGTEVYRIADAQGKPRNAPPVDVQPDNIDEDAQEEE